MSISFNCSATTEADLDNISFWITNHDNNSFQINDSTTGLNGTYNQSSWSKNLGIGNYTWGCLGYDVGNWYNWTINKSLVLKYSTDITGTVNDSSGRPISNAIITVKLNNTVSIVRSNTSSDSFGNWKITNITPGVYTICAYDPNNGTLRGDCTPHVSVS
jgi:hypothetical protein